MSSLNRSLALRLMRPVSLISLIAIALVGGISYKVFSNPTAYPSASVAAGSFPSPAIDSPTTVKGEQTLVLAGGCFWGVEAVFDHLKGVSRSLIS